MHLLFLFLGFFFVPCNVNLFIYSAQIYVYQKNGGMALRGDKTLKKAQNIYEGTQNDGIDLNLTSD